MFTKYDGVLGAARYPQLIFHTQTEFDLLYRALLDHRRNQVEAADRAFMDPAAFGVAMIDLMLRDVRQLASCIDSDDPIVEAAQLLAEKE